MTIFISRFNNSHISCLNFFKLPSLNPTCVHFFPCPTIKAFCFHGGLNKKEKKRKVKPPPTPQAFFMKVASTFTSHEACCG